MPLLTFPQRLRLKTGEQFRAVYDFKRSVAESGLVLYAKPNGLEFSRLGLSVSKKVGNAVVRNRYKRLFREIFRLNQYELPLGLDSVVIPRKAKTEAVPEYDSLSDLFNRLARELGRRLIPKAEAPL